MIFQNETAHFVSNEKKNHRPILKNDLWETLSFCLIFEKRLMKIFPRKYFFAKDDLLKLEKGFFNKL